MKIGLLVLALGLAPAVVRACGTVAVCGDVTSTLAGTVSSGEGVIAITWSTDNEDSSVIGYRVRRYNCEDPDTCSALVANVSKVSSCGVSHAYEVDDTPATPLSQWRYTVEVWSASQRACSVDVTPQ